MAAPCDRRRRPPSDANRRTARASRRACVSASSAADSWASRWPSVSRRLGHQVHVYERAPQPGGLATWHDFGPFVWDRFYHVILPSDTALVEFIRRIGLAERLHWSPTRTGYYVDRQFHSLSSGLDFLRFPLLGLWSKFRLVLTILYCSTDQRLAPPGTHDGRGVPGSLIPGAPPSKSSGSRCCWQSSASITSASPQYSSGRM